MSNQWISVEDNPPPAWTPVLAWNVIVNKPASSAASRAASTMLAGTGNTANGKRQQVATERQRSAAPSAASRGSVSAEERR